MSKKKKKNARDSAKHPERRNEKGAPERTASHDVPFVKKEVGKGEQTSKEHVREGKRKQADEVTASLSAIYEGQPTKEWMNTIEHGRRKTWMVMLVGVFALFVLVVGAAWVGFYWWGGRGFSGEGVSIQIEGPSNVSVGQKISYFINWYNIAGEPLASSEFRVSFPNDFVISDVDPEPTNEPLTFRLGAQSIEARGTIKVTGMFTGALGTKSAIQVIGTYRPASFNSDFEELVTKDIEYTDSVLEGELDAPAKVMPGDEVTIRYTVTNTGSEVMEGLRARFVIPEGFVQSATGTREGVEEHEYVEELDPLEPGDSAAIELTGSFALGSSGDIAVTGEAGYLSVDGSFASAQRTDGTISVLAGDLHIELVINGSQDDRSVSIGEWQRIAISYENTSGEELEDVTLVLHLESEPPDGFEGSVASLVKWEDLDEEYGADREGGTVTYTDAEIEALESLTPNEDGFIELSVPIRSTISSGEDVPIRAYVKATIASVGDEEVNRVVETRPIMLRLQSDAEIDAVARYASDEGAPVGSGPLPPEVGTATTYRIEWRIQKSIHAIDRVAVSASLPKAVSWGGVKEIDAGDAGFDPDLKLVTWNINKIPEDVDELLLSFDVKISPSEADVGRFAKLLSETRFEFTDSALGESILRTSSSLNTDLPDDPIAKRKGVVTKP